FFSSRRRHTRFSRDWSSDVCSSDLAEAIQTILRREAYPNPYEALKDLTRGKKQIDKKTIHAFIDKLDVNASIKMELKKITPQNRSEERRVGKESRYRC